MERREGVRGGRGGGMRRDGGKERIGTEERRNGRRWSEAEKEVRNGKKGKGRRKQGGREGGGNEKGVRTESEGLGALSLVSVPPDLFTLLVLASPNPPPASFLRFT